ncbi:Dystonin [Dufourea novaeangliae]|uniref:Dystonin n=1 Tax=Dufourea novaeangliae TaxID=178035 RepID=A0A154PS68_DUFNO|nr:Dystonin [Dufourea novaeangliae]
MSMYRFSKGGRLFVQGTREDDPRETVVTSPASATTPVADDLTAIYTKRRLSTEVLGSSIESTKTSRHGENGTKRIVTRIVRKTTTLTRGEERCVAEDLTKRGTSGYLQETTAAASSTSFSLSRQASPKPKTVRISDIVVGQEPNVTAREALLRWARRSTARYPGVRVTDFTGSWRDGLAFSALIHRNRPDLVDWRGARSCQPRERLDRVFHVAEREYGVTRLLDPEDVDTPEPDEKSLITYISSLYDVFPEPPAIHPLYDAEAQRRSAEYRELASSLHLWIREKMSLMQERAFPPTLIEMKKLAADSTKFKNEEVPPRYRDKQRLAYIFRDLQKYFEAVGEVDMEPELHIDVIEKNWNRLIMLHQEREQAIIDEIKRLERLQRLAEKVHREMKTTDNRLEELERRVEDEARRLDRLHPLEAKHAGDLLEQDIRNTEIQIQNIFTDVHTLTEGRYSQAAELHKRVQKLHQRWVALRSLLHKRLVQPLAAVSFPVEERVVTKHRTTVHETRLVDTNPHFRALHDCIDWCKAKIKQLQDADYGSDLPSVQNELDNHQREHKNIEQFHPKVDRCVQSKNHFHGEELTLYSQHLVVLQKLYAELLSSSNKRLSDLDTLHDFIQSATGELVWLSSKEETEVTRDWSDKNLNVQTIEQYYESLMSDLEKREIQFSAVQDRGEALVLQHHPAAKTIEAYMSAMQSQWAWLLQLTLCLEVHLKHAAQSQQFFREIQQAEQWISKRDETLNTIYSQSDFSLDEGERLLKGMQELREELNSYGDHVQKLVEQAKDVVPMKQRRQPVTRPMQVTCVCSYKQVNMSIEKGEQCTLYDNSGRIKWRVKNQEGVESPVPGVCFALQPPDKEALDAAERLRRQYDRSVALWQRKQLRLRQNMIFATIKVVKGWDLPQFLAMGQDQRTAIRKALNEDAEKLLSEGDPADPQLRRLKREMAEVNKLFDELEKRARAEEESKNAGRIFNEQVLALQQALDEAERILNTRIAAPLPRDLDSLEHLVLQHKDYEQSLRRLAPDLDRVQQTFRGITLKTPAMRNKLDAVTTKWNHIWNASNLYIERLKCVEILLSSLEENTNVISEFEVKLASFDELPSDIKGLQNVLEDLRVLQNAISQQQSAMDQLNEDAHSARRLVEKSRPSHRGPHTDMDRLDAEVNRLNVRWTNVCGQLVDRVRGAEAAYSLAQQMEHAYRNEVDFVDESYGKLEVENAKNLLNRVVERAPAIEAVNVTGGRLIREGKIYGQRLRAFKEQLEDLCPSMDASVKKPRREFVSTVDDVARNLDNLNMKYTTLVNILQERVRRMATLNPEDASLQDTTVRVSLLPRSDTRRVGIIRERRVFPRLRCHVYSRESNRALQEQKPLRTFRTEFNIYESSTCEERFSSTTTHYTQSQYSLERHERTERTERTEKIVSDKVRRAGSQEVSRPVPDGTTTTHTVERNHELEKETIRRREEDEKREERSEERDESSWSRTTSSASGGSVHFSEIRSLKRIERADEGMGTENVIESRGIVDPRTGNVLTVGEAISLRILDVRRGRIVCSRDGKQTVTIEEAAREKMIDTRLADRLLGPCGYDEEGRPVSLLEAIQRELYDAEKTDGTGDRAKVTYRQTTPVNDAVSVADAIKDDDHQPVDGHGSSALDPRTGELVTEDGERLTVEEAHAKGYLAKLDVTVTVKRNALPLSDVISQGLVDETLGRVLDRVTGKSYSLDEAVEKGILDSTAREIVDVRNDTKVTLVEAMKQGIMNPVTGKYMHGLTMEKLSLKEARRRKLIVKPMTLKDCRDSEIIDESGRITSPAHRTKLTVTEAIERGVLDADRLNSIVDARTGEAITLSEALNRGLINPEKATYRDANSEEELALSTAVEKGLVTSLAQKTIFDIDGFRDPLTGEYVSLNAALLKGLISSKAGGSYIVDPNTGETVSLAEAEERGYVRPEVSEMLNRGIGIIEEGKEITLLEAVFSELLDPKTGLLLDPRTKRPVSLENALKRGLITPDGAALLTGLLNVTVTTQTVTKVKEVYPEEIERAEKARINEKERSPSVDRSMDAVDSFEESLNDSVPRAIGTTTTIITKERVISSSQVKGTTVINITDNSFETVSTDEDTNVLKPSWSRQHRDSEDDQNMNVESPRDNVPKEDNSSAERRVFELPTDGWPLSEAIDRKLFDPITGLFIIPGTDRLVSFEECVKLRIIDPNSSFVVDPNNGRKVSLLRSLEKNILDSTGHYTHPQKISMKEAIGKGLIILEGKHPDGDSSQQRLLRITKVSGEPDKLELSRPDDPSKQLEIKINEATHTIPDPVRVSKGLIYDPSTALVISTETGKSSELLSALFDGTLPSEVVIVKDPVSGKYVGIAEAIQRGILNAETAEYKVDENRKISLLDAAKFGIVSVVGSPLVPVTSSSPITETAPPHKTETVRTPVEETSTEGDVEPEDLKRSSFEPKYKVTVGKAMVSVSNGEAKPIVLQKMRKRVVRPEEALESGLIDAETAEIITVTMAVDDGKPVTLSEALKSKRINAASGKIVDPQREAATKPQEQPEKVDDLKQQVESKQPGESSMNLIEREKLEESLKHPIKEKDKLDAEVSKTMELETGQRPPEVQEQQSEKSVMSSVRIEEPEQALKTQYQHKEEMKTLPEDTSEESEQSEIEKDHEQEYELESTEGRRFVIQITPTLTARDLVARGAYDLEKEKFVDPETGDVVSFNDFVMYLGMFDPDQVLVKDLSCKTGDRFVSLREAISKPLVDRNLGYMVDPKTEFSLHQAIMMNIYDPSSGKFTHPSTNRKLTLAESCRSELIDPLTSIVRDVRSDRYMPLTDAISLTVIDETRGTYNTLPEGLIDLKEAFRRGHIVPSKFPLSIEEAIASDLYRGQTGLFVDPRTNESLDLTRAFNVGLLDPDTTALKDATTGQITSLLMGIENGAIDVPHGRILDSKTKRGYPIDVALERGLLVTLEKPLTHQPARRSLARKDEPRQEYTIQEAIENRLLDPNTAVVRDPKTGRFITINSILTDGILDPSSRGTIASDSPKTPDGKLTPRFVRFGDVEVFFTRPLTFEEAIDEGHLSVETGKLTDPKTGDIVTLKDAVGLGIVDSDSALIKDTKKKKLVKLAVAFRKGLMDAEKGNVLETETSRLYPLSRALEAELLITPKRGLPFIEALEYGLYDTASGRFDDPFQVASALDRVPAALREAIDAGSIDPSGTVIKEPGTGRIVSLLEAISVGIVDPIAGRLCCEDQSGKSLDFAKALDQGYILTAEARQAVEEKYKLCDETSSKLLQWITEVEEKLANQENVKEDVDELRTQINAMKGIKEDLEAHARPVSSCLDQIRQVVLTGGNVLSSEEVSTLEKNGRSLKTRFDRASDRTERMVKRLIAARDELVKFKNELSTFSHWLDNARRVLEEKEHSLSDLNRLSSSTDSTRDFISDVIAHQADLRFITMAAQKFVDESKEFLHVLNEFRTSLPQRLSHKEPMSSQDSPVRGEVSIVTAQYKDLLSRANLLSDKLSGVGGRQRDYRESLEKARRWLKEVEPKVHRAISEAIAAEPKQVEEQLSRAKALNNDMLANERLVENVKVTVDALLRSLDGQLTPKEVDELEEPARALEDKYRQLTNAIAEKCQELDAALVRSQGVQDALDNLVLWLNNIESQFKNIQRPASLQKERLEEQQRDQRLLQADLDSHRLSVEAVASSARDLLTNSSNAKIAKHIESKLKDVQGRFEKLMDKSLRRGEFLDEIGQALGDFLLETSKFDSWYAHIIEALESRDLSKLDVAEYETKMANLMDKREDQRANFEDLIRNGKTLISKKDVTDVAPIRDKIKALETQWKEVNNLIDEKQRLSKSRAEQLSAYEKLRDQVIDWLTRTENKVQTLEPVAVDLEKLKRQVDELKPIQKEYRDYGNTVDKVNDLGIAYDGLLKERTESPTRRRGSTSPTKRPVRRMSQDGRSPSPAKLYAAQSPVSPGGSSGFSSRRSSQDGFHLEDLSPVQQQLSEINNRYGLLGVRLTDRQTELDNVKDELRRHVDNLKTLSQFLEKIKRQIPKETMPSTKEEADKTAKQIKAVIEEMYEKQSLLDTTRTQVRDLVRRKKGADGVDRLNDEMENVTSRWKSFSDRCKDRIKFLDDVKDFYDTSEGLVSWLGSKERMLGALGPISADPRMVASQVQQVQVLREEFRTQQPQLDHLVQVGENILAVVGTDSADGQRTSMKLKSILDKWSDQLARLDERAQSLGDAVDTSREFDASLNRLRDALQGISDNLDELTLEKDPEDQLRKIENLERQLEGQRPLLADAEAAGEQLCEVLSDPASKSEIHGKLAAVGRMYNNLQKKLDHKKAEIEGNLRDGRQFEASCTKTLGWLADELGNMSEKLLVSADRDVLQQQLDHHEPIYRNVMGKEHEVIMLLNKGRDMITRSQKVENRSLQRDLDKMQSQWDRLKKDILDRHTKLQTCAEHCKKYYKAQDAFLPWLRQAEDRLECLKPASFKRKDIEKQLKELSSFRNEVWKHSGEFENNKTLGETFLGACDIDKQNVKNELGAMKTRWDKLNNDLLTRTQSLEDTARHLMDFNENLRDLRHGLQRCEDKLASHDANKIRSYVMLTYTLYRGVDATHLQDEVDNLTDRINDLQAKLDDRCNELQSAATAVAQFNDHAKSIGQQVSSLEKELDSMKAPGREIKIVRSQIEETSKVITKVNRLYEEVTDLENLGERLVDYGFAADAAATREQVAGLKRQIGKLDDRSRDRHDELTSTLDKLQEFYQAHVNVMTEIDEANDHFRRFKPVGSEVESIKAQQEDFRLLKLKKIEPLARAVDDCNLFGQALIQTAGRDVNTGNIEKDVDKMNERWNDLKDRLNERDRRLDVGLLQSGKFQEALDGLEKWLTDTEEMVSNQKSPSSDYKVVKAQLQEQKFLKKMLMDRQNSMSSLYNMGQEVAAGADPKERKMIEKQLKELVGRFDNLTESAAERMDALEQAMGVAKQFQDKLIPLAIWLDKTEKRVRDMELVPTDEEKIQQRVAEHDALHEDILSRKPDFSELTEIASQLMALVGEDEAATLADKLQDAADRYAALVERSEALGTLLQRSRQGLRHLVLSYQELQAWMEGMEIRLSKYRILAVHTEKLLQQMEDLADLTEEVSTRQTEVDSTTDAGLELMKHISSDEALQLKDKLDSLQRRFNDLVSRGSDLLKHAQESLPLVQQFHDNHNRLMDWMQAAESALQSAEPREDEIVRLEMEISEYRPVLDKINAVGPQLSQLSPGEGAATIEGLVTRDNRRFDAIAEQIQRKAERIQLSKQRSLEVIGDIDDLLEWFREVDNQLREAEPPSSEPEIIRVQLKEHKALNDDISSQKGRVRDVISTAKKVIRENGQHEDTSTIREKMEDLRETMEIVSGLSADRLGALEQALPLAEHLRDTHIGLVSWLEEAEHQVAMLPMPALRPDLIAAQQDKNELLMQSINEHRPLVEKLNKTGEALLKLCNEEEGIKIQDILEADTARYAALRAELRSRQQTLEQALQESSQFSDKLEGMLRALSSTADQVNGAEPISAHPPRLRDQMEENTALVDELAHRSEAYAAVRRAADDVISKAGNRADPAVKDIKRKLEKLNKLWSDVQKATNERGHTLDDALSIAEKFWSELNGVMSTLRELQDALAGQAPPAAQPAAIQQQQVALQEIRHEIDQTKPDVEQVRASGHELMGLCGEPDKPEVRKHIEDLDQAWDNVTALYARREENLIDAMEKAMEFHETLQNLVEFLQEAEDKFARMGPLGSDIDEVKKQIKQLANFKAEVDPHMVKVEALNRQAAELTERTSSEQAAAIKEPLGAVNKRWDGLLRGVVERQRLLENALLRLGQFQHALDELLVWIEKTDDTLDNLKAVAGDPQVIEVELAKLKVLVNDIQAHQTSVDTLNDAGRQLIEDGKGTAEASTTAEKLGTLNRRWRDLLQRAADRQRELEDALREAQSFTAEIQDLLSWLGDVDNTIVASKPVGGLPETASEQLERFMEVYNELEQNRPKVETVLQQGQEYLKRADTSSAGGLNHNLRTLKQRWDNVTARASDKKIKLEIALKEATEFHDALQAFVDWLTNAEKILTNLKPVSRVMETILGQIEEHKSFQKDVTCSKFHDAWSNLMNWLDETERTLDEVAVDGGLGGNDPEKIKARLNKHRELQKALSAKQGAYDVTMKNGKSLKDKAPKTDEFALKELLNELKNKWTTVCGKCVDRQRKLEEALLFSGQFKDAIQALLEWLSKSEKQLANTGPLHGDLDTVVNLVEQHKTFEKDLESRASQMESVIRTGRELLGKATPDDASAIGSQLTELNDLWNTVSRLCTRKTDRLEDALREAERLHKAVHVLLEWLSDAEMKLRFAGQLPEDEQESRNQLMEHEKFLRELRTKETEKDQTLELAHSILGKAHPDGVLVIKHWITIIQSRWEEVATWAQQRNQRLENHMRGLQDLDNLLEELLSWLEGLENTLNALEAEPLPDDKPTLEMLIADHREFMENTSRRQNDVDRVCKARQIKQVKDTKKITKAKSPAPTSSLIKINHEDNWNGRQESRASPGRERTPDSLPHIGPRFPPKGSKGAEPEFRSPRVKLLWDRWRHVWMLAWERQRRLQDKYNYIQELDRVANFSWEDWRKRFLKFMNHKKSRLTDLFRKMDKNNDGLIPREDFIQGIMNTKFETSRLEMGAVADLFDRHGEGLIDWKEFIAALRPDWEERRTYNDTDKIHDEVKRLVMLCTCRQKFRVFQVGEGKYRFGDSQKLRLVRILRSTVMVRVGGGWVALDEFLLKNDPCRAKGRTNIELREQFILADGVSQTMTAFKSKPSPTSTLQRAQMSSANTGPITKFVCGVAEEFMSQLTPIFESLRQKEDLPCSYPLHMHAPSYHWVRERSARSVPMGQTRASRSSLSAGTPDSLSDNESSFRIGSARKTSTPYRSTITPGGSRPSSRPASRPASRPTSRPGSRPASRQGSKPPSRYGSTQSLDSTDDSTNLSRIPRRTTVSTTGNTPTSSRHNSVSGKRLGTPVNGSSSRPRTPTGLVSPASGVPARFGTIHRASSIPTLTGVGTPISRSRIPVYVGTDIKSPQSTTSNISTHSMQSNDSTVSTDSTGSSSMCTNSATNTSSAVKPDRTRTPSSGSSTPLPPSLKLSRKPSGASDTSVSTTPTTQRKGKPTPIDQRAPFRL